jgi:mannose-6-phosphate isomerase-like protein (cupin superfamily)
MDKVNLAERFAEVTEYWRPRVAAELGPGELLVVPGGVEHRPVADEEVELLLFEPAATRNTGNVVHPTLTAP